MNPEPTSARSSRRSASLQSWLNLTLFLIILVLVNFVAFKHYKHKDLSSSQYYTLSDKTRQVLAKLDAPITIYTFLDEQKLGQVEQVTNLLKEYQHAGGKNINVEKIDPDFDIKRAKALQEKLHFSGTDHLIIFEYKDRSPRFVNEDDLFEMNPMTGQMGGFKGEQQITGAITALVEGKASKIYFTEGHGEHSIQDAQSQHGYGAVAALLKNENVETTNLQLSQKGEVPADAGALVIAGPSIAFSPLEVQALDKYLTNNGKLIILLDPYTTSGLEDLLKKYGLKFEDDLVLTRAMTATGSQMTVPMAMIYQGGFSSHAITTKFAQANLQLIVSDARSITLPPTTGQAATKTQFLLQTDADAWGWISRNGAAPADPKALTFDKTSDLRGPITIAAEYDGGTTTDPASKASVGATRIIAVGCSKFLENTTADQVGVNFFTNAIDWLVKKDAVLDIAPKKPQEYAVSLNPISFRTVAWCAVVFIPGAALALGVLTWFSRRK